jgi:hypothetical protein
MARSAAPAASDTNSRRTRSAQRCREKFLDFFPDGFRDATYLETERAYKWDAHQTWRDELGRGQIHDLYARHDYAEIARRAVRIESRTNLLFSFEKMALREAIGDSPGASQFAKALTSWLESPPSDLANSFERWTEAIGALPHRQSRVLTWPVVTVFGFLALPRRHMLLKPNVTRRAADAYGYSFRYSSKPRSDTYLSLLEFARHVRADLKDLAPRDMIDIQSFLWVQGSDEYA